MLTTQNDIAGSAVFWTLGEQTDHKQLARAFQSAGLVKFTPEPLTNYAALRAVLEEQYPGHEVFAVKGATDKFEVVKIQRGDDPSDTKNEYRLILTAQATRWGQIEANGYTDDRLTELFKARKSTVAYHVVSRVMVEIVYSLGGTTLRPSGGVYWIPNASMERWEMIAAAVEAAGAKNKVYALRTILDENSANVLRDALTQEIAREAREIESTLCDPKSGLRAARTAKDRAAGLRRKIETYETSFEISLADLRRELDSAVGIEAKATLMDLAAQGPLLAFC